MASIDTKALQELMRKLGEVKGGRLYERAKKAVASESIKLIANEFRTASNPEGQAWLPPNHRTGRPLSDRGLFRKSWDARVTPTGFVISSSFVGAAVHNFGAVIKPKKAKRLRFRLPVGGKALKLGGRGKGEASEYVFKRTVVIPQRQIIPNKELGDLWKAAFDRKISLLLNQVLGGHGRASR